MGRIMQVFYAVLDLLLDFIHVYATFLGHSTRQSLPPSRYGLARDCS